MVKKLNVFRFLLVSLLSLMLKQIMYILFIFVYSVFFCFESKPDLYKAAIYVSFFLSKVG